MLQELRQGIYERDEIMQLALLAAVAGESIFLLGPPGVAKSLIARRLKHAFKDGKSFEYLMNRFSTPDEIFGPVSIQKLKQDQYERQTANYLPGATVVFLDEIWKAGPSIQNTLLTVLNEKVYRNGAQEEKLPLRCVISASNELPAEGEGLEALWDRFLVRYSVGGIKDLKNFQDMIVGTNSLMSDAVPSGSKLEGKVLDKWADEIAKVKVPVEVLNTIHVVRGLIQKYNEKNPENEPVYVSDRRWKKIVKLLRASAFLNDRKAVDLMDCLLIPHCIWQEPGQFEVLQKLIESAVEKHGYSLGLNFSGIKKAMDALEGEVEQEIYIKKVVKESGLKVNSHGMVEVVGMAAQYGVNFLEKNVYESLPYNVDYHRISFSIADGKSRKELYAKRTANDGIMVSSNSYNGHSYKMAQANASYTEILHRKPNAALVRIWDDQIEKLGDKIKEQEQKVEEYRDIDLQASQNNLFVPEAKFALVTSSLNSTMERLGDLKVDLKKLRGKYLKVQDGKIERR